MTAWPAARSRYASTSATAASSFPGIRCPYRSMGIWIELWSRWAESAPKSRCSRPYPVKARAGRSGPARRVCRRCHVHDRHRQAHVRIGARSPADERLHSRRELQSDQLYRHGHSRTRASTGRPEHASSSPTETALKSSPAASWSSRASSSLDAEARGQHVKAKRSIPHVRIREPDGVCR